MKSLEFVFPLDSVMLMDAAGTRTNDGLQIKCIVNAAPGRFLQINGVPCIPESNMYNASVLIKEFKNTLTVVDTQTGESERSLL